MKIFDPTGVLISSFGTGSSYTSGITWNGNKAVIGRGTSASNKELYEMDLQTGELSGPFTTNLGWFMGLGFDGANILVSNRAEGANGVLTSDITMINATTYTDAGTMSVTVDTETDISSTPIYGVVWHDNNLFLCFQGVDKVYRFDDGLDLIEEIPIATEYPRGIAFIKEDLFVADRGLAVLYRYSKVVPTEPTISIYTDGTSYTAGDKMLVRLDITNPGDAQDVSAKIEVEKPDGSTVLFRDRPSVTLRAGLEYSKDKEFTLPSIPAGTYTWHAQLSDLVTGEIICEDTAEWVFGSRESSMETADIAEVLEQVTVDIGFGG